MKAWHVFELDSAPNCNKCVLNSLLVFAPTRNKARSIAFNAGLWEYEDYIDVRAKRRPEYDKYAPCKKCLDWKPDDAIIATNDDLPREAPKFYDNEAI